MLLMKKMMLLKELAKTRLYTILIQWKMKTMRFWIEALLQQEDELQSFDSDQLNDSNLEYLYDNTNSLEPSYVDTVENNTINSDNLMTNEEKVTNINEDGTELDEKVCENNQNTCCHCCRKTKSILRKLNDILSILNASKHQNVNTTDNIDFSRLGNFPLQTVKHVEDFERKLKEVASLMELYKKNIARIGGDNAELAVRNALKYILTDEVAVQYSWTGQKQTIKFSQHKIVDGIVETIIKTGNTTLTDLQNTVKEWLRHAGDRVRYQRKKELIAMGKV